MNTNERYKNDPEFRKEHIRKCIERDRKRKKTDKKYAKRVRQYMKEYSLPYQRNKYKINSHHREKMKTYGKFHHMFRELVCMKRDEIRPLIGCTLMKLAEHLENQFQPEMTWDNYGKVWWIDHIDSVMMFDLTKESQRKACWHYTNLRPMKRGDNIRKGKRFMLRAELT